MIRNGLQLIDDAAIKNASLITSHDDTQFEQKITIF